MLTLLSAVALAESAALPEVTAAWRKGALRLSVSPPPGEHVAEDAPVRARLTVGELALAQDSRGDLLARGLVFTLPGDGAVRGELELGLCQDQGGACRTVRVAFQGEISGRKGEATWKPADGPTTTAHEGPSAEAVFASAGDRVVLLDFGAIWCPPCNLLNAEVLDDPADAAALAPFALARIDVDRPESWTLKDRYHVGGYPTVVAARADGVEIDRLLGYPGEAATLAWLASLPQTRPISELGSPETATPEVALAAALRLAEDGRAEEAQVWWARVGAPSAEMAASPDHLVGRLLLSQDLTVLPILAATGVGWRRWLFEASQLEGLDAASRALLREVGRAALFEASGAEQADLLWLLGAMEDAEGTGRGVVLYSAAAVALEGQLTGDPALDRGHYTFLADLYASSGQVPRAVALLQEARVAFPGDFTWPYALANTLLDAERAAEALPYAEEAVAVGYGDNRLRAVKTQARVLVALGRQPEALALLDRTLAEAVRPAEGLDVRTPRYLKALEDLRAEIAAPK